MSICVPKVSDRRCTRAYSLCDRPEGLGDHYQASALLGGGPVDRYVDGRVQEQSGCARRHPRLRFLFGQGGYLEPGHCAHSSAGLEQRALDLRTAQEPAGLDRADPRLLDLDLRFLRQFDLSEHPQTAGTARENASLLPGLQGPSLFRRVAAGGKGRIPTSRYLIRDSACHREFSTVIRMGHTQVLLDT